MRILILTCNTGGGHNACARGIQQAFIEQGDTCDLADALAFVSKKLSKIISQGHTTLYRHTPGLFRAGYGFAEKHPSLLEEEAAAYKLLTGGTEQLFHYLTDGRYDTVICTHIFSGLLLRQTLKEYPLQLRTGLVATDYTCSPGAAKCELDHYFIPAAALQEEFIAQGVPKEKISPIGIPIRQEFYSRADRRAAKQKLGIAPSRTHLLVMCGSMGCGPMKKLTKLLCMQMDRNMELSVVCGTNEKLKQQLQENFAQETNVHIYGFVQNVTALMDSADLYLTKPGGLSTTEAAAKGLPMVFVDAVAGCEEYNLRYFVSVGGAVTADTPEALVQLCLQLLRDEGRLKTMGAALENALPCRNAAQRMRQILCEETTG